MINSLSKYCCWLVFIICITPSVGQEYRIDIRSLYDEGRYLGGGVHILYMDANSIEHYVHSFSPPRKFMDIYYHIHDTVLYQVYRSRDDNGQPKLDIVKHALIADSISLNTGSASFFSSDVALAEWKTVGVSDTLRYHGVFGDEASIAWGRIDFNGNEMELIYMDTMYIVQLDDFSQRKEAMRKDWWRRGAPR